MNRSLLVEFDTPDELASAALALRALGHRELDAYTPYSTEVVREALALGASPLPRWVLTGGLLGAGVAYSLEWYLNGFLYPLNVGGRPPHMPLAFVPIAFEMGVLCAAFAAVLGVLVCAKLVKLWDPVFELPGFDTVSVDRFWLRIDSWPAGDSESEALKRAIEPFGPRRQLLLEGAR